VTVAVALALLGVAGAAAAWPHRRRPAPAAAPAVTVPAADRPAPSALPPATALEAGLVAALIDRHPDRQRIRASGHAVADYLRTSLPDLSDVTIGRVALAIHPLCIEAAAGCDHGPAILADSIAAAACDLTALERHP